MSDRVFTATQRIEIRKGFERVIKGATLAGDRVFRSRAFPLDLKTVKLPAILIYSGDEDVEEYDSAPRELRRTTEIWVEAIGIVRIEFEDVLDVIAAQVEHVVNQDETLGGICSDASLARTERGDPDGRGARTIGAIRMRFDVIYHTQYDERSEIPTLDSAGVTYDLAPPDATPEAVDELDLTE